MFVLLLALDETGVGTKKIFRGQKKTEKDDVLKRTEILCSGRKTVDYDDYKLLIIK